MKKTKFILTILCILTLTIGSCLTVCAEETIHSYEFTFSENSTTYCIKFTSYYDNCALVLSGDYYSCYRFNGTEAYRCTSSDGLIDGYVRYKVLSDGTLERNIAGQSIAVYAPTLTSDFVGISAFDSLESYIASFDEESETEESTVEPTTEEPTIEPTTEEPTTEPSTEEPEEPTTQEPTTPTQPDTDNTDAGLASDFITKLIGTEETFTPQNVMAIFVICLILECISHIASSLLNMSGGLK